MTDRRTAANQSLAALTNSDGVRRLNYKALRNGISAINLPAVGSQDRNPIKTDAVLGLLKTVNESGFTDPVAVAELVDDHIRTVSKDQLSINDYNKSYPDGALVEPVQSFAANYAKSQRGEYRNATATGYVATPNAPARPATPATPATPVATPVATATTATSNNDAKLTKRIAELEEALAKLSNTSEVDALANVRDIQVDAAKVAKLHSKMIVSSAMTDLADTCERVLLSETVDPLLFRLSGPAGSGKTVTAQWLAHEMQTRTGNEWAVVKIDCSTIKKDEAGFLVVRGAANATTTMKPHAFAKAIANGNVVILLDELNRAPAVALQALLGMYDDTAQVRVQHPDGSSINFSRNERNITLATMNVGRDYVGTGTVDLAIQNRFEDVKLLPPLTSTVRTIVASKGCNVGVVEKLGEIYFAVMVTKIYDKSEALMRLVEAFGDRPLPKNAIDLLYKASAMLPAETVSIRRLEKVAAKCALGVNESVAFRQGLFNQFTDYADQRTGFNPANHFCDLINHTAPTTQKGWV